MHKLVIFDMDGVLLDSEPCHALARKRIFGEYDLDEPGDEAVGLSVRALYAGMIRDHELKLDPRVVMQRHYDVTFDLIVSQGVKPTAGLSELIVTLLARGLHVRVASSSPRAFVGKVIDYLGFTGLPYLGYEDAPRHKPAPDIYLETMHRAGVGPREAIAVEDSAVGVAAAMSAGLDCVGYINPTSGRQDLSAARWRINSILSVGNLV